MATTTDWASGQRIAGAASALTTNGTGRRLHARLMLILTLSIIAAAALGVSSCVDIGRSEDATRAQALDYLAKKYGKPFQLKRFEPASNPFTGQVFDEGIAASVDEPGETFVVTRNEQSDDGAFADGYAYRLAEKAAVPEIRRLAAGLFGDDSRVTVGFTSLTGTTHRYQYTGSFSLDDLISREGTRSLATIKVFADPRGDAQSESALVVEFARALASKGYTLSRCTLGAYFLHRDQLDRLNVDELRSLTRDQVLLRTPPTSSTEVVIESEKSFPTQSRVFENYK